MISYIYNAWTNSAENITIKGDYTEASIVTLKTLIENGQIEPDKYTTAILEYDAQNNVEFPLHFAGGKNIPDVSISKVSAGYNGIGSKGAIKCLELMKFKLSKQEIQEILTKKNQYIYKKYEK